MWGNDLKSIDVEKAMEFNKFIEAYNNFNFLFLSSLNAE
jgi:hypothetical protein